jgi:hypothetical protein
MECDPAVAESLLAQTCDELVTNGGKADGVIDDVLCGLGFKCRCGPDPSGSDEQLLDDVGPVFGCGGPCRTEAAGGYEDGGFHHAPANHGARGGYHIPIAEPGYYLIEAYMPYYDGAATASYAVNSCSGFTQFDVDQTATTDDWVELGLFELEPGAVLQVAGRSGDFVMDAITLSRR